MHKHVQRSRIILVRLCKLLRPDAHGNASNIASHVERKQSSFESPPQCDALKSSQGAIERLQPHPHTPTIRIQREQLLDL